MNESIRRQALQTTAKIALSLTVYACGGTVDVVDQAASSTDDPPEPELPVYEEEEPDDEPPILVYVPEDVEEEESLVCQAPAVGEEVTILDGDQLACCVDHLEPTWPAEGPDGWQEWQDTMQDEGIGACCNVVVAHANLGGPEPLETIGWENIQRCCEAAGSPFGPACTPWGPPVPPAMRAFDSLDALELA